VVPDPADRRSKVVRRTSKGTRLTRKVQAHLAAVEADWARQVGARRYADFRATLAELAQVASGRPTRLE
jgi:DNA-binding MarR family transcriptional regulator